MTILQTKLTFCRFYKQKLPSINSSIIENFSWKEKLMVIDD